VSEQIKRKSLAEKWSNYAPSGLHPRPKLEVGEHYFDGDRIWLDIRESATRRYRISGRITGPSEWSLGVQLDAHRLGLVRSVYCPALMRGLGPYVDDGELTERGREQAVVLLQSAFSAYLWFMRNQRELYDYMHSMGSVAGNALGPVVLRSFVRQHCPEGQLPDDMAEYLLYNWGNSFWGRYPDLWLSLPEAEPLPDACTAFRTSTEDASDELDGEEDDDLDDPDRHTVTEYCSTCEMYWDVREPCDHISAENGRWWDIPWSR
jgi:hypothetical protein